MVRVKIGTDIREYPQGTTWAQVAEEYQSGFEHDILLVQIGGKLQELHKTVRDAVCALSLQRKSRECLPISAALPC